MLKLMLDKLVDRKERERAAIRGHHSSPTQAESKVSDSTLFAMMGDKVKWEKPSGN
jgi:hypothetical protein